MSDRGPTEFYAWDLAISGPFAAEGSIKRWFFGGNGDQELEFGTDLEVWRDTLTNLVESGIGIYCVSNRCRTRYLTHRHNPTLVAAVVGQSLDNRHFVTAVTLTDAKRRSSKRMDIRGTFRDPYDVVNPTTALPDPVDLVCPRCRARGSLCVKTFDSATMQS